MPNLQAVLELLRDRLNAALTASPQPAGQLVVLSNLVDADGSPIPLTADKVVLSLLNIDLLSTLTSPPGQNLPSGGPALPSPLATNLYVLAIANFSGARYATALDQISRVIAFVHDNSILISQSPSPVSTRFALEFVNLDASQWNDYLHMAGITYLPAIMLRVRPLS